jgi:hypothetical protein
MELSEKQPEEVLNEVESIDKQVDAVIAWAQALEKQKLEAVFTRFCFAKMVKPDYNKVKPRNTGNNTTEYHYRYPNGTMYLLMTSEFKVVDGVPKLEIIPNKELAFNDEI